MALHSDKVFKWIRRQGQIPFTPHYNHFTVVQDQPRPSPYPIRVRSDILTASGLNIHQVQTSRSLYLMDIQSRSSKDIRPDSNGIWGWARLILNNGKMVVVGSEGDLALAAYPFENFIRMQGHNVMVSNS